MSAPQVCDRGALLGLFPVELVAVVVLVVVLLPPEQGGHHLFQNGECGEHDSDDDHEPRDRCQPRQKAVERIFVQQEPNQGVQTDEQEIGETDEDQGLLVCADGDQGVPPCACSRVGRVCG